MAERGAGGWRGLPEGGGGGSRRKRRQRGFDHCVDSSVAAGKGAGKATVRFLLRGQLDTRERCPGETEDRPRILANAQAWLGHRAAVCGHVVTDTVGSREVPGSPGLCTRPKEAPRQDLTCLTPAEAKMGNNLHLGAP